MQIFPIGRVFDFMAMRRPAMWLSTVLVLGTLALLVYPGAKLGTDFRGGTEVEVAFLQPVTDSQIREAVTNKGFSSPDVIHVRDDKNAYRFLIRVEEVATISPPDQRAAEKAFCFGDGVDATSCPESAKPLDVKFSPGGERISLRFASEPDLARIRSQAEQVPALVLRNVDPNPILTNPQDHKVEVLLQSQGAKLMEGLRASLGDAAVPPSPLRVEWVGPKAGAQLRNSAIASIAIALVLIMVYIAVRFDLRFAPGAIIALIHDAIVPVGALILLGWEVNLTTIAALLTIVGYSVNDTVVVYDRIRENLGKLRGATFAHVINVSLSEMLSRTILTSSTAIFAILCFFFWGTGPLKDFAFTLVVGMLSGVYSSIYIALPFTAWLDKRLFKTGATATKSPGVSPVKKKAAAVI